MTQITIIGATGFAGSAIAAAAAHSHQVTALSRNAPAEAVNGVNYVLGSAADRDAVQAVLADADVVVAALSPRGDMSGHLVEVISAIAHLAADARVRLIVVGGAGALHVMPGGPRVADGDTMPAFLIAESRETAAVVNDLEQNAPAGLDWLYVSPAFGFSPRNPGEATGTFTFSDSTAVFDTYISAADFGAAIVSEIERHDHEGHVSVRS